jgi:hypothetical protein
MKPIPLHKLFAMSWEFQFGCFMAAANAGCLLWAALLGRFSLIDGLLNVIGLIVAIAFARYGDKLFKQRLERAHRQAREQAREQAESVRRSAKERL